MWVLLFWIFIYPLTPYGRTLFWLVNVKLDMTAFVSWRENKTFDGHTDLKRLNHLYICLKWQRTKQNCAFWNCRHSSTGARFSVGFTVCVCVRLCMGKMWCTIKVCVPVQFGTLIDKCVIYMKSCHHPRPSMDLLRFCCNIICSFSWHRAARETSLSLYGWGLSQSQDYKIRNIVKYRCKCIKR